MFVLSIGTGSSNVTPLGQMELPSYRNAPSYLDNHSSIISPFQIKQGHFGIIRTCVCLVFLQFLHIHDYSLQLRSIAMGLEVPL
jgi:hypothetical protein